jgi:hypothetical protein
VSTILRIPDELAERLAAEAGRRHISVDELAVEFVKAGLDGIADSTPRRRLPFIASGASGSTLGDADAAELLAEDFGRE